MISKRFLGVPLISVIISLIIVACLCGGYSLSAFLFNQQYGASVKILSDEIGLYLDQDCTQNFNESATINFSDTWAGTQSEVSTFYIKNESGAGYLKPSVSVSGLPQGIMVSETQYGNITNQPNQWTNLYTPENRVWTSTGLTCHVGYYDMNDIQDSFLVDIDTMPSNSIIKIDDEIMSYSSIQIQGAPDGRWHINGLQRGLYGTKPAAHAHLAVVEWGNASYTPFSGLGAGQVQAVNLRINADETVEAGDFDFTIFIQATSQH